jgi:transcriptional regulator with XRE-family HTH domain
MTQKADRMLSSYIDAWLAGERPRLESYLQQVDPAERDQLAEAIDDFLTMAPTPRYSEEALAAIRAEAMGGAVAAPMPALLTRVRKSTGLSLRDLAGRLSSALSLGGGREEKVAEYVGQLERGELDGRRVSRRVIEALGRVLSIDPAALEGASLLGGAAPAGALFRGGDADAAAEIRDRLETLAEAMATPPPGEWDEVDELFLGGR